MKNYWVPITTIVCVILVSILVYLARSKPPDFPATVKVGDQVRIKVGDQVGTVKRVYWIRGNANEGWFCEVRMDGVFY